MECGTARIEITPPFDTALFGYPENGRTYSPHKDKILDPLQARSLYIQTGSGHGILLITLDLCIILTNDADFCRKVLSAELGIPFENIFICCTHTHSAPLARFSDSRKANEPTRRFITDPEETSLKYGNWLLSRIRKIASMAIARKAPASLGYRETFTGMGYNRRVALPEGILNCWNLREFPSRVPVPMERLRHCVMNFTYIGKQGGVILEHVGIHPVVMGKESYQISGDWPCYARRHIEKRLSGFQALFTQGAGAQVQPWISTQGDPKCLRWVGEAIGAEAVMLGAMGDEVPVPEEAIRVKTFQIGEKAVEVSVLELGRILLVMVPFELSATWADEIVSSLNRPTLVLCLCNGWDGYWMSPDEFDEGGYEVEVAHSKRVTPEDSRQLRERLLAFRR